MGFTFLLNKSLEDEKGIPKRTKKRKKKKRKKRKVNYVPHDDDEKRSCFRKGQKSVKLFPSNLNCNLYFQNYTIKNEVQ